MCVLSVDAYICQPIYHVSNLLLYLSSKSQPINWNYNFKVLMFSIVVPADKAQYNFVFVCKKYYILCLLSELDQDLTPKNPTYSATTLSIQEIIYIHKCVLSSFCLSANDVDCDLPSIYRIPKLHKNPYQQMYIDQLNVPPNLFSNYSHSLLP